MGTGVTELKREVMLREWSARIAECRGSGSAVKEWCAEQDISVQTYKRDCEMIRAVKAASRS